MVDTTIVSPVAAIVSRVDSMIALPIFLIIGLLVLGAIVAVVMLLAHPKTRVAGAVLVAIGLAVVVVVGGLVFGVVPFGIQRGHRIGQIGDFPPSANARPSAEAPARIYDNAVDQPQMPEKQYTDYDGNAASFADPDHVYDMFNEGPSPAKAMAASGTDAATAATTAEADPEADSTTAEEPEGTDEKGADADAEPTEEVPAEGENTPAVAEAPEPEANPPPADTPAKAENAPSTPRPDWVDAGGKQMIEGYQVSVAVGPLLKRSDCDKALPAHLHEATASYIRDFLGDKAARRVQLSQHYIRSHIIQSEWEEPAENPLGPRIKLDNDESAMWTKLHVLLQFDRDVDAHIEQQWKAAVVHRRLAYAGIGLATVLGLLSVLFGTLKIDQSTGGKYRGRLSFVSIVAVLGLLAAVGGAMRFTYDVPRPMTPQTVTVTPIIQTGTESPRGDQSAPPAQTAEEVRAVHRAQGLGVLVSFLLAAGLVALFLNSRTRPLALGLLGIAAGFSGLVLLLKLFDLHNHVSVSPMEVLEVVVSAVYLVLITVLSRRGWAWALGLIACLVAAMLLTPADPVSMTIVAVPLCIVYTIAAFAFRAGREGPASGETPGVTAADVEVS